MAKTFVGVVSSDKADKTIVVKVATRKTHPIYKKQYTATSKFMAHDEQNDAHDGDKVVISETKPLSKHKRFVLDKVLERAPVRHVETVDEEVAEVTGTKEKTEEPKAKEEAADLQDSTSGKPSSLGQAKKTHTATGSVREKK
jgi:small subunit ribosomal protein S17